MNRAACARATWGAAVSRACAFVYIDVDFSSRTVLVWPGSEETYELADFIGQSS